MEWTPREEGKKKDSQSNIVTGLLQQHLSRTELSRSFLLSKDKHVTSVAVPSAAMDDSM